MGFLEEEEEEEEGRMSYSKICEGVCMCDQFSMIRVNILMMVPLPDLTQVYRMVAHEETDKEFYQNQNQNETLAFVADKRRFNDTLSQNLKSTGNSQRQGFNNSTKRFIQKPANSYYCTHCKLAGHSNDRCFTLHGYPAGFKVRERRFAGAVTQNEDNSSNTSSAPVSMQQYNELLELLNKHKMSSSDQHSKEPDIAGHAMLAGNICLLSNFSTQWLLDSGATDHISNNLSDFISFNPVNDIESHITIPDGRKIKALSQNQPPLLLGELQNGLYTVAGLTMQKKSVKANYNASINNKELFTKPAAVTLLSRTELSNENTDIYWKLPGSFVDDSDACFHNPTDSIDHTSGIDQANSDINVHSPFTNTPSTSVHTSDNSSASTQISSSTQSDILPVVPVRQS
ncbi:hypothetical protein AgCh_031749 [Apium graveolens]